MSFAPYNLLGLLKYITGINKMNKPNRILRYTTNALGQPAKMQESWAIIDLDNCLADDSARIPLIDWSKPPSDARYQAYHEAAGSDPVNERVVDMLRIWKSEGVKIAIFTARPAAHRMRTKYWLGSKGLGGAFDLLEMRPDGDTRSSVDLKREMFANAFQVGNHPSVSPGAVVIAAIDDHEPIVEMYQDCGIHNACVVCCHQTDVYALEAQYKAGALRPDEVQAIENTRAALAHRNVVGERGPEIENTGAAPRTMPDGSTLVSAADFLMLQDRLDDLESSMAEAIRGAASIRVEVAEPGPTVEPVEKSVPDLLSEAAGTYRERNKTYGDSYKQFGPMMLAIFPDGLTLRTTEEWNMLGVFMQAAGKLLRYGPNIVRGGHIDSAHDAGVYSFMLEELTRMAQAARRDV